MAFDPGHDLNAGAAYVQGVVDAERKTAAYNALAKIYGSAAGDPAAALKMQAYGYHQQADPLDLQSKTLANTGAAQTNAFNAQEMPLKLQSDQFTVAHQPETFQTAMAAKKASIGDANANAANAYARAAATTTKVNNAKRQQQLSEGLGLVNTLQGIRDNAEGHTPGTGGAAVSQYLQQLGPGRLTQLGIDPQHVAPLLQSLQANPGALDQMKLGITNQINAMQGATGGAHVSKSIPVRLSDNSYGTEVIFSDGSSRILDANGVPVSALAHDPGTVQDVHKAAVIGTAEGKNAATDLPLSKTEMAKQVSQLRDAKDTLDLSTKAIDAALKHTSGWTTGPFAEATKWIPGTPAANMANQLAPQVARNALAMVNKMRAMGKNGSAGFQIRTQQEVNMLGRAVTDLTQSVSPTQFRANLTTLKDQLTKSYSLLKEGTNADLAARGQKVPGAQSKTPLTDQQLLEKYGVPGGQ